MSSVPDYASPPPRLANRVRRRALVSLTPLIDLVFILLVFFMLASSFLDWRAIELESPQATQAAEPTTSESLVIDLRQDGLFIAGEAVTSMELTERVRSHAGERIYLRPEEGVSLQRAVALLDRLNALGARDLSLIRAAESR